MHTEAEKWGSEGKLWDYQTASGAQLEGHGHECSVGLFSVIVMFSSTTFSYKGSGKK